MLHSQTCSQRCNMLQIFWSLGPGGLFPPDFLYLADLQELQKAKESTEIAFFMLICRKT